MRRGQVDDRRLDEMKRLGVDAGQARRWLAEQEPEEGDDDSAARDRDEAGPMVVWPGNGPVVALWMQLQTQWRHRPTGALEGLRYEAVRAAIALQRLKRPRRLFRQLVEMEHEAVEAWNGC